MRSISKYDCVFAFLFRIVSSRVHQISHFVFRVISSSFYSLTIWYRFQFITIRSTRQISKRNQKKSLLRRWNAKMRIHLQCEQDFFVFISIFHVNRKTIRRTNSVCSSFHSRYFFVTYFRRRWIVALNINDLSSHSFQRTWIHSRYDSNILCHDKRFFSIWIEFCAFEHWFDQFDFVAFDHSNENCRTMRSWNSKSFIITMF